VVSAAWFPDVVCALYALSPLSVASCVARSTDLFVSVFVVLCLLGAVLNSRVGAVVSGASLAAAASLGLYPVVLAVPVGLMLFSHGGRFKRCLLGAVSFVVCAAVILAASYFVEGRSWGWLNSVYWFLLTAPDRTPNIGLWWYFFLELFTHFEVFFTIVFQASTVAYAVPLAMRYRSHPLFVFWVLCATTLAMLQPYPSLSHVGLHLAILPFVWHEVRGTRLTFATALVAISLVVLLPNATRAWLLTGTGNVNFYYFAVMALQGAHLLFISDCLAEVVKRDFLRKNPNLLEQPLDDDKKLK
jgi:phosphatidylinositol glycan class U